MPIFGKDLLRNIKNSKLEGEVAHKVYSPPYRPIFNYEDILLKNPKFAAVNILLYLKNEEWHFPLIVRSINEKDRHSGQISLPGGKKEKKDPDFSYTAKRETSEELGIEDHYIRIIREMSSIYIPPSNFYVHSFISYTKRNPTFFLQETEAVELIEFPISSLLNLPTQPKIMTLPSSRGQNVPVIDFNGYIVWGATSMILSEFSNLLKNV